MRKLQDARYQLTKLKTGPKTPKMIRKVICAMEKHAKLDKVVRDWHKQDAAHKKAWKNVKKHFAVGIRDVQDNPANKKESGYANKAVENELEEVKDNTKSIAEQLLESQQVAMKLQAKLDELENNSNISNTNNQNGSDKKTKVMTD